MQINSHVKKYHIYLGLRKKFIKYILFSYTSKTYTSQEGGNIFIIMAELLCCMAEMNRNCKAILLQFKKNKHIKHEHTHTDTYIREHMCLSQKNLLSLISFPFYNTQFSSVQSFSHVRLFVIPWTAAPQASLSIINSWNLLKLVFI